MSEASRPFGWRGALRLVTLVAACAFISRGIDWRRVGAIMRAVALAPLVGVVVINAAMMIVKAIRLRLLLGGRSSVAACFLAKLTASTINNVVPFRAGDVARMWMLEQIAAITKPIGAVIAVVETLLELLALAALVAAAVLFVPEQRWASWAAPPLLVLSAAVLLLMARARGNSALARRRIEPKSRLGRLMATIDDGSELLRDPWRRWMSILLSVLAWCLEAVMVVLCARALTLPMSLSLAIVVLLGINVAIVLPSLPASAGAFEAGAVFVLMLSGIGKEQAVSFAILYHLVHVIPVTIVGAVVIVRMGPTLSGLRAPPTPAGSTGDGG